MYGSMRVLIPSVIVISLPMLGFEVSAAEKVMVPEGNGTWEMTISPEESGQPGSLIMLAQAEEPVEEGFVPDPLDAGDVETRGDSSADEDAVAVEPANYWAIYRSIPFIRTEYLANPSYRHEATMELLTGHPRPVKVVAESGFNGSFAGAADWGPSIVPPYVYDRHLGYLSTFFYRYRPPAVPMNFYPLGYPLSVY